MVSVKLSRSTTKRKLQNSRGEERGEEVRKPVAAILARDNENGNRLDREELMRFEEV